MTYNHNNLYTKFLNNASKTLEFIKHCFSQSEPSSRACACFHANYIKGNINIHLYLKFEREILKIVKVMAVLIVFLNARASSRTDMHACAFMQM